MVLGYCSKCKTKVEIDGGEEFVSKGKTKRPGIRGSCPTCGTSVIHWTSKYESETDLSQGSAPEEIPSGDKDGDPSLPPSGVPETPPEEPVEIPPAPTPPTAPPLAPAEEEEETKEEEEGVDWGGIFPIIAIVLGVIALIVGVWVLYTRSQRKKEEKAKEEKAQIQQNQGPVSQGDVLPEV